MFLLQNYEYFYKKLKYNLIHVITADKYNQDKI